MAEGFGYFEHGADIGVFGRGASIESAFAQAAAATFAIMAEPQSVASKEEVEVEFDEDDVELALPRWLNALLAAARERGIVLGHFTLRHGGAHWHGRARGEPWSEHHARGTEVKGATLTALAVRQVGSGWEARCVVDV